MAKIYMERKTEMKGWLREKFGEKRVEMVGGRGYKRGRWRGR